MESDMNENEISDESDELDALTVEEYSQVKALFDRYVFDLELEGEDLVLYADCEPELEGGVSDIFPSAANVVSVKAVGSVKLKQVIAHSIQCAMDEEDDEASRDALFAISGRLRELAALVEQEAAMLDKTEWDKRTVPMIEPRDEEEGPDADYYALDDANAARPSSHGGNKISGS
jgi:hypothetical protein